MDKREQKAAIFSALRGEFDRVKTNKNGLAASSIFPALMMGIFNRSMNKAGAISGMLAGLFSTLIYIFWFKGYGNMIIIDHGDNYYTVYAHAEELFASKGDTIDIGDVVATVGDSGSIIGPSLHFEVRHHGKPVDPLKWIKKG